VRLGLSVHDVDDLIGREPSATGSAMAPLPELDPDDPALLIYTSGTTGRPKGVVLRHANLAAQMASLHQAWGWSGDDHILEVLPLHHVHGLVNVVGCALWAGATCRFLPRFDAGKVWRSFVDHHPTLFMAVPTIYSRLIEAWEAAPAAERQAWSAAARRMRLMVSGSAALPVPVLERWRELTGHTLLERYGMSEIGMALSNPLLGERIAGTVGAPLPGVELRLVSAEGESVDDGEPGELEARGETVFREYWRRADATRDAFRDGWFRTGDVAVRGGAGQPAGVYRLLGRSSTDILKSGGEKISALEIEAVLRRHPQIADCAVVGLADELWGQRLAAAVELADGAADDGDSAERQPLTLERLRAWGRERLAPYKLPTRLLVVEALPRNALGKVQKPRVVERFEQEGIP
ncbi:MAG: acyl-CoA synthetase, partial [Holophagales bacterium]|nr:acyl-CoA synthetase [Holophagales bacterium]